MMRTLNVQILVDSKLKSRNFHRRDPEAANIGLFDTMSRDL